MIWNNSTDRLFNKNLQFKLLSMTGSGKAGHLIGTNTDVINYQHLTSDS